ncbi:uncharacterized protein FYW47_011594 [Aplochiton taeniatus]
MSTIFSFQSQLVSIMDALSKTAVQEISKLVEIESKNFKIEITRGRNEIASLTEKLQLMENLLWIAQGRRQDAAQSKTLSISNHSIDQLQSKWTSHAIKSESLWECIGSSTCTSSVHQGAGSPVKPINTVREQHGLILVKDEPLELDLRDSGPDREKLQQGVELDTDAQKINVGTQQNLKDISDEQLNDSLLNHSNHSISTVREERLETPQIPSTHTETQSLQLRPTHITMETGNDFAGNVLQSVNMGKNMKIHSLRTSSVAKRFGCLQCGKYFRCFSQLEIHQRSHTGEKPFRCSLCGKRYAQKGHLYTHQRTHTGEKPYRCPMCGKGFIQKCTLDMHQRTHTGEKPFVCVKCGKGFTKNCNLKKHLAVHTDLKMHLYLKSGVPLVIETNESDGR